jgi:hypothetical protein
MERGIFGAIGIAIALVSGFFVAAAVVESATGGDGKTSPGVYAGLIIFFGGLFLMGAYLAWRMLRPRGASSGASGASGSGQTFGWPASSPSDADRERRVLRIAEQEKGRVTVAEVATHCDMTIAEAKATLDRLVLQQAATIQATKAGVLVYVFPGFLSDEEKSSATDF